MGLVVSDDLDLPVDEHMEIPPRFAGPVEDLSGGQAPELPERSQLFEDVRGERGKPLVGRVSDDQGGSSAWTAVVHLGGVSRIVDTHGH